MKKRKRKKDIQEIGAVSQKELYAMVCLLDCGKRILCLAGSYECDPELLKSLTKSALVLLGSIKRRTKVRLNRLFNWKALNSLVCMPMPEDSLQMIKLIERGWRNQVPRLSSLNETLGQLSNISAGRTDACKSAGDFSADKQPATVQVGDAVRPSVSTPTPAFSQTRQKNVEIYTDGACPKNPGRGGYGCVLLYKKHRKELFGGYRRTTNNRMEMMSAIVALRSLNQRCTVQVNSDSRYLVDGIMKGWARRWRENNWMRNEFEPAINSDLWEELLLLCAKHDVTFKWIPGHRGHRENERCDRLAAKAARSKRLEIDLVYEQRKRCI